jgi:hypothetical protein
MRGAENLPDVPPSPIIAIASLKQPDQKEFVTFSGGSPQRLVISFQAQSGSTYSPFPDPKVTPALASWTPDELLQKSQGDREKQHFGGEFPQAHEGLRGLWARMQVM